MKRALLLLFALAIPTLSFAQVQGNLKWSYTPGYFRNTSAASVAREANWAKGGTPGSVQGFVDSLVMRVSGANAVGAPDTTVAFRSTKYPIPFNAESKYSTALVDTATAPWIALRVSQDSTSYSWTGAVVFDSLQVAAQISYDGINWFMANGTPTIAFDATAPIPINGADGATPQPVVIVEQAATETATIPLKCDKHTAIFTGGQFIINKTLCMSDAWIRFLIGQPGGGGQFKYEIGHWEDPN